jgi:cyclic beta-1,2-glucan synthetase
VRDAPIASWDAQLRDALARAGKEAGALAESLLRSAERCSALAWGMDFRLLYDADARRFRIGYNASADRFDANHYDLLASEARLASFFAIAKADVPPEHWFHLGRPLHRVAGRLTLVSWGGSMFEYLMPPLFLRSESGTLLAQSERNAIGAQRRWARKLGIPWGASESAFASFDPGGSYRYQSFGVPGLGLRRGLARDRVVAPYASALALPIRPSAALRNLRALESLGLVGPYGFVDSADFTPERLGSGRRFTPVMTFMAHHQGMILAALDNALCGDALVRRFHADLRIRTAELLLHERIPHEAPATFEREEPPAELPRTSAPLPPAWTPAGVHGSPRIHTLGNGRLASWTSAAGAGALRWEGLAVTRWRPDATRDASGLWIYLRDAQSGEIWSVGRQPTGRGAGDARATFHPHLVELHRREHGIATRLDVAVAHGDDVEIRRVTLANESGAPRELIVTSYAEVALAPPLDDERHPAFSKLFVRTEWLPSQHGLLFKRRPRRAGEPSITAFHGLVSDDAGVEIVGHEADRAAFLGRGGSARSPLGVSRGLTGTTGFTLDPVMAIQARVVLEPYGRARLAFLTFAGGSRESVLETASRYETLASLEWAIADAGGGVARELQRLAIPGDALPQLQAVGSLLLAPSRSLGASAAQRAANLLGQTQLWGHGISGDLPILLLRLADPVKTELMDLLVRGLAYWRQRGIETDLVIVRSGPSSYAEPLRERLHALLRETGASAGLGRRGGVHLVFTDQTHADEIRLLACCARVVLDDARGTLAEQLAAVPAPPPAPPPFPRAAAPAPTEAAVLERPRNLAFDNGLGGFSPDGREYVIHLEPGRTTPAPWSNVLANERFGCLVTESGGGFTWSINSGENRLTACSNDPVADPPSEALLLRDEETGGVFSITPRPAGDGAACQIRHGAGTTSWRRISHGLDQTLCVFVAHDAPVKIARVELQNRTARPRRLTATYWAEWLLGSLESASRSHVVCSWDARAPALLARNPWNADFAARVAFLSATLPPHGVSADRREFLGPEGDLASPAALERWGLSGRVDPGADPGAAYQVHLDIPPDGRVCFSFVLGQGGDRAEALALATEWRDPARIERARAALGEHWDRLLGAVQVHTPDAALDLLVNRWLLYQVVSSRLYARAGFYQANGAFGFRDQLQDTLALLHVEPRRVRAHLLLCAAHQFEQGDVLHWWHPPADRGVRTRCSDDLLWLPYAVSCYVEATGDAAVLDERVRFLQAPELAPLEHDRYSRFEPGAEATLFEHCRRALERGVTSGRHGLPRIGSGDWNDGFDRVGARGDGESVWLGWFAFDVMNRFAALCERRGERELATHWRARASALGASLAAVAWDGAWWLRAFDDDGRPLGSHANTECRIDSVSQSWAVLSGARQDARAREALASAQRELVQGAPPLVRLFWPPFHASPRDPGYVKVYPPGIRENGGQYNHAAAWLAWACAEIGDTRSAAELLAAINPILRSAASCERYRVEPYVLAGDVSSCEPHTGRGGWTWYTGSAAWAWRLVVEQLLGIRRRDGAVMLRPRLPSGWDRFEAVVRGARGALRVRVRTDDVPAPELTVDGEPLAADAAIPLPTAELERKVDLRIPRALPAGDDDSTSA